MYLQYILPYLVKIILGAIIILLIYNWKCFKLRKIDNKIWIILGIIFLATIFIRTTLVPQTHYVYFDEFEHINVAQNILYNDRLCECFDGNNKVCNLCFGMPRPPGYHTFLSLIFEVFGDSERMAFLANITMASLSVVLMFFLIYMFSKSQIASIAGAFLFSLVPVHLKFSGSTSMEILSIFLVILSMIILELYIKHKRANIFLLFVLVFAFAVSSRIENVLLVPIFMTYLFFNLKQRQLKYFWSCRYIIPIIAFIIVLISIFTFMNQTHTNMDLYPECKPFLGNKILCYFGIDYLKSNLPSNLTTITSPYKTPLMLWPLFLTGLFGLYKNKKHFFYLNSFFIFIFLYSSYHIGNFVSNNSFRYSIILYIPLIIIGSLGIKFIANKKLIPSTMLIILFLISFLISVIPTIDYIQSEHMYEQQYQFILSMEEKLPKNVYIMTTTPVQIISTIKRKAITPNELLNKDEMNNKLIWFKDLDWLKKYNENAKLEHMFKERFQIKLIKQKGLIAFYELTPKENNSYKQ